MVREKRGIHNTNDLSLINKWIFDRSAWQWIFKAIFQPFSTPVLLVHLQSALASLLIIVNSNYCHHAPQKHYEEPGQMYHCSSCIT